MSELPCKDKHCKRYLNQFYYEFMYMVKHGAGRGGKGLNFTSLLIGFAGGVIAAHVFKSAIDSIYTKIPVLGSLSYYGSRRY